MRGATRRARQAQGASASRATNRHHGATSPYQPLADTDVRRIVEGAMRLLDESGFAIERGTEADRLFAASGCSVSDDGVVKIPPRVIEDALGSVARSVTLWDRPGERGLEIDNRHTRFLPGMTCIKVYDRATGEPRDSNREDLAEITRVADALEHVDGVCVAAKNVARSDIHGEIDEFAAMAENTTKPLEYLCEQAASLELAIAMAAEIRGSRERLRERPYFLHIVTPLPLNYTASNLDQIVTAARAGVPVSCGTLPIGGASSPITMAGAMVHSLATDFAGMVLGQLAERGAFSIGSSDVCFMEPATGGIGGFAETSLADMAMCQIRRSLDLPSFTGFGGCSAARRFNQDAVWEISTGLMQAFYSRPATCDYLGSLDQGLTYSLPALLLCNDVAGLLKTLWGGILVDEESLALDLMCEVGPRGNFLAQRHTAQFCRSQVWHSRYFGANMPVSTSLEEDRDLIGRIQAHLDEILETHRPEPLDPALLRRLDAIKDGYAARHAA
jgi:trimethylamine:corrinoid methyltransferase-like protein